jgi:peptidoglycan/LPS O-acetylase OafA/YrhL
MPGALRISWPIVLPGTNGAGEAASSRIAQSAVDDAGSRIAALDGLRGVLAMIVVVAHYFGEVPHGFAAFTLAWVAVRVFFVLSGFLMARIILENLASPGFFKTFYIRRACRTLPVYLVLLVIVFGALHLFRDVAWMQADRILPLWSFLTFTQGFVMVARNDFGSDWLTPSWTLTVEEQFYLIAPLICLAVPRRHLLKALWACVALSIGFRVLAFEGGVISSKAGMVLLPGAMHAMFLGMIGALLLEEKRIDWSRWDGLLRVAPLVCLSGVILAKLAGGEGSPWFEQFGVPLVSVAAMLYLMAIVRNAPEAERLRSHALRVLGRLSYSIYLLHMPVLGLMHGLILGGRPDIGTWPQIAVTFAAVPVALALAWVVNRTIEQPMIAYGRTWKFRKPVA